MRYVWDFAKLFVFAGVAVWLYVGAAYAQQSRTFADKPINVRLCPSGCIAVNGHSYKPGGTATILERQGGWARLSAYLDRAKLVPNFGDKITAKPALWVPLSAFVSETAAAPKPPAKKAEPRRVSIIDRMARLRRPARPTFRPDTQVAAAPEPAPQAVSEPQAEAPPPPAVVAVEQPAPAPEPQAETPPAPVEVVQSQPVQPEAAPSSSSTGLTWEQVQARLAQQQSGATPAPAPTTDTSAAEAARRAQLEAEARAAEQARIKQQEAQRQAALKAEKERLAKLEEQDRARREAEQAELKRVADAAAALKAKLAATQASNEDVRKANEARRLAEENRQKAARAAREAERAKQAEAKAARDAANEAERKRVAAAEAAADPNRTKVAGDVGYTPPKESDAAPAAPEQQVAIVLPPTAPVAPAQPAATAVAVETPEPVYKAADSQPIAFGKRPTKLTKALLDKRLRKLPGSKSKVPRQIVIAMRHYALGLLKNGECKGIARGGPSTTPNMIYIACTDDPDYLRQFPIVEETW